MDEYIGVNHPNYSKMYSRYLRLKHGPVFLLCLFEIEENKIKNKS